jgi:hypothetical protein
MPFKSQCAVPRKGDEFMVAWKEFAAARPDLAAIGKRLLYQYKVGYAFLATVRKDGAPRVHPVCPALADDHLYVFIAESPKRTDLLRDGRYALHTFPPEEGDEEFYCSGRAEPVSDAQIRAGVVAAYHRRPHDTEILFELKIERALHTTWENWATPKSRPHRTWWHAATL